MINLAILNCDPIETVIIVSIKKKLNKSNYFLCNEDTEKESSFSLSRSITLSKDYTPVTPVDVNNRFITVTSFITCIQQGH